MKIPFKTLGKIIMVFLLGNSLMASAQGDLLITPVRVVFEGAKQMEELSVSNISKDTARYNISFVQYRMTQTGAFQQIEKPDSGQMFADKMLRIFPRVVTLAPNETQVRCFLRSLRTRHRLRERRRASLI